MAKLVLDWHGGGDRGCYETRSPHNESLPRISNFRPVANRIGDLHRRGSGAFLSSYLNPVISGTR